MTERRDFFRYATARSMAVAMGTASATTAAKASASMASISAAAGSSALQTELAALYDVDRTVINLDAAYYGAMTREVQAHYFERLMWVNCWRRPEFEPLFQIVPK